MGFLNNIYSYFSGPPVVEEKKIKEIEEDYVWTSNEERITHSPITEKDAMSISPFKASVEMITSLVTQLPLQLKQNNNGNITKVLNDKRVSTLNGYPNKMMSSREFMFKLTKDLLLYGRSFIEIDDGSYYLLDPKKVSLQANLKNGRKVIGCDYYYISEDSKKQKIDSKNIIFIDRGRNGILVDGEKTLTKALNELDFSMNVMKNGIMPTGVLETPNNLTSASRKSTAEQFSGMYAGTNNSGKTLLLEQGLTYKPLSLNPQQLELTAQKKAIVSDIARLFGISEDLINAELSKYSSNPEARKTLLQTAVQPLVEDIQIALTHHLLSDKERSQGYFFQFDTSEYLRASETDLIDQTTKLVSFGLISKNEARKKLGYETLETDKTLYTTGTVIEDEDGTLRNLNLVEEVHATSSENSDNLDITKQEESSNGERTEEEN